MIGGVETGVSGIGAAGGEGGAWGGCGVAGRVRGEEVGERGAEAGGKASPRGRGERHGGAARAGVAARPEQRRVLLKGKLRRKRFKTFFL